MFTHNCAGNTKPDAHTKPNLTCLSGKARFKDMGQDVFRDPRTIVKGPVYWSGIHYD